MVFLGNNLRISSCVQQRYYCFSQVQCALQGLHLARNSNLQYSPRARTRVYIYNMYTLPFVAPLGDVSICLPSIT